MEVSYQVEEITSLQPVQGLSPMQAIEQKTWRRVYRAECMVPFSTYSLKIVYIITFIAIKVNVTIQVYVIPMVDPANIAVQNSMEEVHKLEGISSLPIAGYSYNFIYCARCGTGLPCSTHSLNNMSQQYEPMI